MARKKKRKEFDNPLLMGLSAVIAVLLITTMAFNTPIISVVMPTGESMPLSFSLIGLPLLSLLLLAILFSKVKK